MPTIDPVSPPSALLLLVACVAIGGLLMLLAGLVANTLGWGVEDDPPPADVPPPARVVHGSPFDDLTAVCICRGEMDDDGEEVTHVRNDACPIHGPEGRRWDWIEITTHDDEGRMRCVRCGPRRPPGA